MKLAIDLILLGTVVMCVWGGYKKGLVMEAGTIIAIIISIYMGNLLSETFSPAVSPIFQPFISGYMDGTEGVIGNELDELLPAEDTQLSVEDALAKHPDINHKLAKSCYMDMGVYEKSAEKMATKAVAYYESSQMSLSKAIVSVMCENMTYYLGFILFFIIILIIITVLGNILNLSFKIPGHDGLNDTGGMIAGGVIGILYCCLIAWALKFTGILLPEEEMSGSIITGLFLKLDLFSKILPL